MITESFEVLAGTATAHGSSAGRAAVGARFWQSSGRGVERDPRKPLIKTTILAVLVLGAGCRGPALGPAAGRERAPAHPEPEGEANAGNGAACALDASTISTGAAQLPMSSGLSTAEAGVATPSRGVDSGTLRATSHPVSVRVLRSVCARAECTRGGKDATVQVFRDDAGKIVRYRVDSLGKVCSHPLSTFFDAHGRELGGLAGAPIGRGSEEERRSIELLQTLTAGANAAEEVYCDGRLVNVNE